MKNWMKTLLVATLLLVTAVGCSTAPKLSIVNLEPAPANNNGFSDLNSPGFTAASNDEIGSTSSTAPIDNWQNPGDEILNGLDFLTNPKLWKDKVYFAFNRHNIAKDQRHVLDELAAYLQSNPQECLIIEGHTDQIGSEEYNRALGEKRALAAQTYLEQLGIAPERIKTVSYGEDKPAIPNADTEEKRASNRRDQFLLGLPKK